MTTTEVVVILGGLLLGYLIVANLLNKKTIFSGKNHSGNGRRQDKVHYQSPNNDSIDYIHANWFLILEVQQVDSKAQIVSAYKQKISQYHPDKVAKMGREIQELAESKSKQINAAYDYAMKLKR